jgi:hypothetical protein
MTRLADAITATMAAAIAGGGQVTLYTGQDHAAPTYTRNPACWAYAACDMTCHSPWNSKTAHQAGATLVHPRIAITVDHYLGNGNAGLWSGTTFRWITAGGTVVDRTVTGVSVVKDASNVDTDIVLLLLNSSATAAGIVAAEVLPSDWRDYLPLLPATQATPTQIIPQLYTDKNEYALVSMFYGEYFNSTAWNTNTLDPGDADNYLPPPAGTNLAYVPYYLLPQTGSSGNGAGLAIGGKFVMLCPIGGGAAAGNSLARYRTQVDAAMDALLTGASLTSADLSGYTKNFSGSALASYARVQRCGAL